MPNPLLEQCIAFFSHGSLVGWATHFLPTIYE